MKNLENSKLTVKNAKLEYPSFDMMAYVENTMMDTIRNLIKISATIFEDKNLNQDKRINEIVDDKKTWLQKKNE